MRKMLCYIDKDNEQRFQTLYPEGLSTDQILESWKNDNPGCKPVALYDYTHDAIHLNQASYVDYATHCEGFGLTIDDLDTQVVIRDEPHKLYSINTRKTKYKIVWFNVNDPTRRIRTTPEHAKWLLNQTTGNRAP